MENKQTNQAEPKTSIRITAYDGKEQTYTDAELEKADERAQALSEESQLALIYDLRLNVVLDLKDLNDLACGGLVYPEGK